MTEFEETSKKIRDLVDEVFKQGVGVGYDHGLEVGTQNGYMRGYENGKKSKTGHWKVVSDGYGDNAYICECSECKDTVWVYKDADRKWNYCPNCGAKMERSDKE